MPRMEKPHPLFSRATEPSCPNCGFALNGLPDSGACPECGTTYNPTNAFASIPPTIGQALLHLALPFWLAAIGIAMGFAIASGENGSGRAMAVGLPCFIAGVGLIGWGTWRTTALLGAIADARPRQAPSSTKPALARAGMIIAFIATIGAGGLCLLLSLAFASCLLSLAGRP